MRKKTQNLALFLLSAGFVICLAVFLAGGLAGCKAQEAPAEAASVEEGQMSEPLIIRRQDGKEIHLSVEIADTPETRVMGLMFRKSLPENAGMLFVFPEEELRSFWMKNTLIPLDMVFIDQNGRIVNIVEQAIPHDLTPRWSTAPAKAVLEINGGRAGQLGIGAGDRIHHSHLNNSPDLNIGLAEPVLID